ncbi:unnamed protein product [Camellia sinensis]
MRFSLPLPLPLPLPLRCSSPLPLSPPLPPAMPPPLLLTVADNWSNDCELSLSLCRSHIDPKSRLVIRLENIEENAQSYVNTGQIHASCDVRHIVEIAFAWAIVDIYFCVRRAFVLYIEDIYFCTILCFGNPVFLYVIFNLDR